MMTMKDADGKSLSVLVVGVDGVDALRKVVRSDLSGVTIDGDSVLMPKYSAATGKDIPLDKSVSSRLERPKHKPMPPMVRPV